MSPVCLKAITPSYDLFGKTYVMAAITLKGLLADNSVNLITEEDQLPRRSHAPKSEREKEDPVSQLATVMRRRKKKFALFFF